MNILEKRMSLVIAAAFCGFAIWLQPAILLIYAIGFMAFPLAAIWYGEEIGSVTGGRRFYQRTPGVMVRVVGWLLLFVTPLATYAFKLGLGSPMEAGACANTRAWSNRYGSRR